MGHWLHFPKIPVQFLTNQKIGWKINRRLQFPSHWLSGVRKYARVERRSFWFKFSDTAHFFDIFNHFFFFLFLYSCFQHSCVKARVNGRDGVIVAGGASDADPNLNMVEFFDLRSHKWMSLGRTRQGRRFPGKYLRDSNIYHPNGLSEFAA